MLKLALLVLCVIPFTAPTGLTVVAKAVPSDSIEYKVTWPQAVGAYGPADHYAVHIASNKQFSFNVTTKDHPNVLGLADSFNMVKPAISATDSTFFDVTVTPVFSGQAGTPISQRIMYKRPPAAPAFPVGAVVTVDSSKIARP